MAVETDKERTAMLHPDEWGEVAVLTSPPGDSFAVTGIFDNAGVDVPLDAEFVSSAEPRFLCPSEPVQHVKQGWEVSIRGVDYQLKRDPRDDGTGMSELLLLQVT